MKVILIIELCSREDEAAQDLEILSRDMILPMQHRCLPRNQTNFAPNKGMKKGKHRDLGFPQCFNW